MEGQALLARIAAGLNFVNKPIDDRWRKFAFLYAAANLKQYLTLFAIPWEAEGPVISFEDPIKPPSSNSWRLIWDLVGPV